MPNIWRVPQNTLLKGAYDTAREALVALNQLTEASPVVAPLILITKSLLYLIQYTLNRNEMNFDEPPPEEAYPGPEDEIEV